MKVCLYPPPPRNDDPGDGGTRRVIEAMYRYLPEHGIEFVADPQAADLIAAHIEFPHEWHDNNPDKPFVLHNHGLYWAEYDWPHWAVDMNRRIMIGARLADAMTVPSEWCAMPLARALNRRPDVIPHGVDLDEWTPPESPGSYVFWDKTRIDPVCDPRPVRESAIRLPDVRFVSTMGEPARNVEIVGRVPFAQARELTRNAGVYLATSRETFGISTLQALACGVPVVGFDWGAHPEWLKHKVTGWLAKPGDFDDLATGILWAFDNRPELSRRSREVAERFPWESAAAMYADLYRRTLDDFRRPRPRVSFIVRAYNLDAYLPATLDSIKAVDFADWECIVVDDASPDRCGAIADDYAARDERFRVVHNAENHYIGGAMNDGVAAARGRYIMAVDADDMVTPQGPAILASALDRDRSIDLAYGALFFVEPDGSTPADIGTGVPGRSNWPMPFEWENQLRNANFLPYCTMYRRRAWEATAGFRTRLRTAEDADFWTRATSYGFNARKVTDELTLIYRVRSDGISRQHGRPGWVQWLGWSRNREFPPGGAQSREQGPIPSHSFPLVSVIIPVGPGHEQLVLDAVDSVEAQTFPWWECIVVNDTGHPLPRLPAWVRVIEMPKPHAGPAHARNIGLMAALGETFFPLDADDLLQPDALERMHDVYRQRGGVIVYSDCWIEHDGPTFELYRTADWTCEGVLHKGIHAVSALTPRAAWQKVGGYDPNARAWEDWDFHIATAAAGYCSARVAEPLFLYRFTTGRRREDHFADRDANLAGIESKWGDYIHGRKSLMACGCSGNQTATVQAPSGGAGAELSVSGDTLRMRMDGEGTVLRTFRAPSGQVYRLQPGQEKYVYRADWEQYFSLREGFVEVPDIPIANEADGPALVSINQPAAPDPVAASPAPAERLEQLVGLATARTLIEAGYATPEQIDAVSDEQLLAIKGIGKAKLDMLRAGYR